VFGFRNKIDVVNIVAIMVRKTQRGQPESRYLIPQDCQEMHFFRTSSRQEEHERVLAFLRAFSYRKNEFTKLIGSMMIRLKARIHGRA
jgi:hypothetical protein